MTPSPPAKVVAAVADAYAERRYTVIDVIFSKPAERIRVFADAFRLRQDDDGKGDDGLHGTQMGARAMGTSILRPPCRGMTAPRSPPAVSRSSASSMTISVPASSGRRRWRSKSSTT